MDKSTLRDKTVKELKGLAQELGVTGVSRLRKAGLVEAILAAAPKETGAAPATGQAATVAQASEAAAAPPPDEPPEEPAEVFIDRGAVLPESYPGTRLRAMVRDPGTLYVYWEVDDAGQIDGWEVRALDPLGRTLAEFSTGPLGRDGYLQPAAASIGRIEVRPCRGGRPGEPLASVEFGMPTAGASSDTTERWVDARLQPAPAPAPGPAGRSDAWRWGQEPAFSQYRPGREDV